MGNIGCKWCSYKGKGDTMSEQLYDVLDHVKRCEFKPKKIDDKESI